MSDDPNNKTMLGIQPFRGDPRDPDDDPVARMRAAQQKKRADRPSIEDLADLDWDVAVPDAGAAAKVDATPAPRPSASAQVVSAPPVPAEPEPDASAVVSSTSPYLSRDYADELDAVRDRFRRERPILLDDELEADRDASPATQTAMYSAREIKAELDGEAPVQQVNEPAAPKARPRAASGTMMLSGADLASALSEASPSPAAGAPAGSGSPPAPRPVARTAPSGTAPLRGSDINAAIEAAAVASSAPEPRGNAPSPGRAGASAPGGVAGGSSSDAGASDASASSAPVSTEALPSHASGTMMLSGAIVRAALDELGDLDAPVPEPSEASAPSLAPGALATGTLATGALATGADAVPTSLDAAFEAADLADAFAGDDFAPDGFVSASSGDGPDASGHTPASDAVFAALDDTPGPTATSTGPDDADAEAAPDRMRARPSVNTIQQAAIDVDRAREIVRARHAAGRASLSDASTAMPGARIKRPGVATGSPSLPSDAPASPSTSATPDEARPVAPAATSPAPSPLAVAPPAPQPTDDELASLLATQPEPTGDAAPTAPPTSSRNTTAIVAVGAATLGVLATIFFLLYWFVLR